MKRLPIDPFLPGMLLVLFGAWLLRDYRFSLDTHPAIAVIFLIQGMMLDNDHLRRGFMSWRVHMVVQFGIFLGFPLVVWGLLRLLPWDFSDTLQTGLLLLAVLPTTISTAVVYSGQSGGNTATALFNATLSNLVGILVVPLALLAMKVGTETGVNLDTTAFVKKIGLLVILPFLVGQGFRWVGSRPEKYKAKGQIVCQLLILYILLATFHGSFQQGVFEDDKELPLIRLLGFLISLTLLVRLIVPLFAKSFQSEHRPAIFFCITEK
ncbi:MAG: bile acid:sodium symporter, partial [Opitutae bacterium]